MDGGHYGYRTPGQPAALGRGRARATSPSSSAPATAAPAASWSTRAACCPRSIAAALLEADAGTRQINFFPITRKGAAFRTEYKVLLASDDPWFRPVDVTRRARRLGLRRRLVRRGRRRPRLPRPDHRPDLPGRAQGAQGRDGEGRLRDRRRPDRGPQVAGRRHPGRRPAGPDRAGRGRQASTAVAELCPRRRARSSAPGPLWVLHADRGRRRSRRCDALKRRATRGSASRPSGSSAATAARTATSSTRSPRPSSRPPPLAHLDALLPLAADPDAGVRRELILALRNLPTDKVGEALKTLAAVLGRPGPLVPRGARPGAREPRERLPRRASSTARCTATSTSTRPARHGQVALPPYFPVDRNEAYIAAGTPDLPASALSKTLGLAWRLHRPEVLPLLGRILPKLASPELQQAADDVLAPDQRPRGGGRRGRAGRRRPTTRSASGSSWRPSARKLDGDWRDAEDRPAGRSRLIEARSNDPELAARRGSRWPPRPATPATRGDLESFARDDKAARGGPGRRRRGARRASRPAGPISSSIA